MPNPDPKPNTDFPEARLAEAEEREALVIACTGQLEKIEARTEYEDYCADNYPDAIAAIRERDAEIARLKDLFRDKPYLSDAELNRVKTIVWCGLGITLSQDVGLRVYEELSDRRVEAKAQDAKILKLERNNARLRAELVEEGGK